MIPAISLIVRTLGSERLRDALASLSAQARRDFEVVIVDMSGGANAMTLEHFASRLPLLRVLTLPRSARPTALNAGIAAASAAAIGILDDDNLYDPNQIELLLAGLESTGADYVYTGVRHLTFDANGALVTTREMGRPFAFDELLMGNFIYATGSAYRKDLWTRLGGYDERLDVLEDWDFLIRAAQSGAIAYLGGVAGESRKFTGIDGKSTFELEIDRLRRSQAGIYWKHRRLYLSPRHRENFRRSYHHHFTQRKPPRKRPWSMTVRGWRLELLADLIAWFMHNLRRDARPH